MSAIQMTRSNERVVTSYQFYNRFTQAEKIAVIQSEDPNVKAFEKALSMAQEINLDHAEVSQGLSVLVSAGLLTEARKTEILT